MLKKFQLKTLCLLPDTAKSSQQLYNALLKDLQLYSLKEYEQEVLLQMKAKGLIVTAKGNWTLTFDGYAALNFGRLQERPEPEVFKAKALTHQGGGSYSGKDHLGFNCTRRGAYDYLDKPSITIFVNDVRP